MKAKRELLGTILFLCIAFLPVLALALPITIVDELTQEDFRNNGYLKGHLGFGPHSRLDYSHPSPDSLLEGGVFSTTDLISASLTITTKDDGDRAFEYGFVYTDDPLSHAKGLSIGGTQVFDLDISQIADDGTLDVTIIAFLGDFYVTKSVLSLTYEDRSQQDSAPVPEPGTLMLLGSGLIGLATMLRKKTSSRG